MNYDVCSRREFLKFLNIREVSHVSIDVILLPQELGLVDTASDGGELEGRSVTMIKQVLKNRSSDIA